MKIGGEKSLNFKFFISQFFTLFLAIASL